MNQLETNIINLKELERISNVSYAKLYFRKTGLTQKRIDPQDATRVANALKKALSPIFRKLGFILEVTRLDP